MGKRRQGVKQGHMQGTRDQERREPRKDKRNGSHASIARVEVGNVPAASPRVGGLAPSDVIMRVLSTSKGLPTMEPKAPASDPAVNYQ